MRRQLPGDVTNCSPTICCPANTSHSRNSALSRPSSCITSRPLTSAWAEMTRQSSKRGGWSKLEIFSM
jgi:hypothetical protein